MTDDEIPADDEAVASRSISDEDLTAERLTELFRHKRVHTVRETDDGFDFIFRDRTEITVDPSTNGEIWGTTGNEYLDALKRGPDDREGLSAATILELGDLVRLKHPAEPSDAGIEYTHGIVVEILSRFGSDLNGAPASVSLHLYNPQTKELFIDPYRGYGSPIFYDQHVRTLVLVQKASDDSYHPRDVDIADYLDLRGRY
jgi:hypothetical protein